MILISTFLVIMPYHRIKGLEQSTHHELNHALLQCLDNVFKAFVKFGLSEKQTKYEKIFLMVLTNPADLLSKRRNHKEDFFKLGMCASHNVQTLAT